MMDVVARRLGRIVLLVCFCALFWGAQAETSAIEPGSLVSVELGSAAQSYSFTPAANGLYSVYLFPSTPLSAHVELSLDGEPLAQGDGSLRLISCRLNAGVPYTLALSGSGSAHLEIARETLSRSFEQPLALDNSYSKLIARSGDVHWYSVSSESAAAALISAVPNQPGLRLEAMLFSDAGELVASSESLPSGAFALSSELAESGVYLLRLSAADGSTGKYRLSIQRSEVIVPADFVEFSAEALALEGYSSASLTTRLPAGTCPLVFCDSASPEVAVLFPDGSVQSHSPGTTAFTAYAYGGATDTCAVTVSHVPVESLQIALESSTMDVGDSQQMTVTLLPENASDRRLTFVTDDATIVTVDSGGTLHAVGEGTARIVAIAGDGSCTDMAYVAVEPAGRRYRALLIGEENYASTVDKARPGAALSVDSLSKLLATADFDGETYDVATLMDASRDEVIAGIRSAFGDAAEQDLSLVYITCHGFYQAGMTFFVMADGSVLSAADLERELRGVPGEIVLLADCCGSGGLLGESCSTDDLLDGVLSVFRGVTGGAVRSSRVRVIASARLDQDSYRISLSGDGGMATVFARALCDAAGWSIDRDAPGSMSADADYDGEITFDELGRYVSRRVRWYLALAGDYVQNVQYYPEGEDVVILSN